jgi:anti-anti-sigma factor
MEEMTSEQPDFERLLNARFEPDFEAATGSRSNGALSVETFAERDTIMISLAGELGLATADVVREALDSAHSRRPSQLVIDLGELTFIDSTGLALMVFEAKRDQSDGQPQLEILPGPPQVQRLFHVAGALERLPFISFS